MSDDQTENGNVVRLEGRLDMPAAARLVENMAERRGASIVIDASDVEHLGGQCLQVLLAAAACWRGDKAKIAYSDQSPAFTEALARFGMPIDALTVEGVN
ncbi:MAG: STAS domain-containing protein [Parvularculaceae bacterium]